MIAAHFLLAQKRGFDRQVMLTAAGISKALGGSQAKERQRRPAEGVRVSEQGQALFSALTRGGQG